METVKVYNAGDSFEVDIIVELLKSNDIECYVMESGTGGFLTIQQGLSIYGKDIYVAKENKTKARKLINEYKETMVENVNNNKQEDKYKIPWFRNRVIVARIIIIGSIFMGILCFFMGLVQR